MFRKCLICAACGVLFSMAETRAMFGCDHKTLNRKLDAYVMAVEAGQPVNEEVFLRDLQFLSVEATRDKFFQDLLDTKKFDELYARKVELPKIDWLADLCRDVFATSQDELKKVQAFVLLRHVTLTLEVLKDTGMTFVPTVFD